MGIGLAVEMFPRNERWSRARTRTTSGPDSDSHVSWLGQSRIVTRAIRGAIRQADSESHVALGSGVRAGPREEKTPNHMSPWDQKKALS